MLPLSHIVTRMKLAVPAPETARDSQHPLRHVSRGALPARLPRDQGQCAGEGAPTG